MVQMPRGIPVATVAIGNAENAALLAVALLALGDEALTARLAAYRAALTAAVLVDESNAEPLPWREPAADPSRSGPRLARLPPFYAGRTHQGVEPLKEGFRAKLGKDVPCLLGCPETDHRIRTERGRDLEDRERE